MKNINKLEPKAFVFDHQLAKHLSKPLRVIIQDFNELLDSRWPVWKTEDWLYFLEEYIEDYITLDDKVKEEFEALRKYLIHEAEFDYIIVGDSA
jgi:hypothetical protein